MTIQIIYNLSLNGAYDFANNINSYYVAKFSYCHISLQNIRKTQGCQHCVDADPKKIILVIA